MKPYLLGVLFGLPLGILLGYNVGLVIAYCTP